MEVLKVTWPTYGHTYHLLYSGNTLGDLKDEKQLKGFISIRKFDTVKETGSTFV